MRRDEKSTLEPPSCTLTVYGYVHGNNNKLVLWPARWEAAPKRHMADVVVAMQVGRVNRVSILGFHRKAGFQGLERWAASSLAGVESRCLLVPYAEDDVIRQAWHRDPHELRYSVATQEQDYQRNQAISSRDQLFLSVSTL